MLGDELFQYVVGVTLALDALDLQRLPQIAAQGCCYFYSHRFFPLRLVWFHKAIRTALFNPRQGENGFFFLLTLQNLV